MPPLQQIIQCDFGYTSIARSLLISLYGIIIFFYKWCH